mgnify:CR=1 FL=1
MILFEDRASTVLYKVLSVIENKKFLLPLNICPIVPDTLIKANKEFEFIDISLDTLCMSQNKALKKIQDDNSIDGILFVKTFGIEFNIQPFYKKIKEINNNVFIIDDMCLCAPKFDYDIENSYADMSIFSSGYSKYVDIGYGGYGFIEDKKFRKNFQDTSKNKYFLEYKKTIIDRMKPIKMHKDELNCIYKVNIPRKYHWEMSLRIGGFHFWQITRMRFYKPYSTKRIYLPVVTIHRLIINIKTIRCKILM